MTEENTHDPLEQGYREFCEAWLEGKSLDLDEHCRKYSTCEAELRLRIERFRSIDRCLDNDRQSFKTSPAQAIQGGGEVPYNKLGDFRLIREIGRGGMGVVYEAQQLSLNRTVALKVLPAHLTLREETVTRFKREAATAGKLNHPGIVEIFTIGDEEGNHFFAMEFVNGAPLDRIVEHLQAGKNAPLTGAILGHAVSKNLHSRSDPSQSEEDSDDESIHAIWDKTYIESVCRIMAQVTEALDFAHQSGVIHRDVKPSNILVREDGTVLLTDFGLAREEGLPSLTITGELSGTPHYIAPEQATSRKEGVDHRVDIYSLGVTLYELLTLARPFEGNSSQEVLNRIVTREPSSLRDRNELIPKDLETICLTAMEKDPGHRYQTAKAFGEDLQNFLAFRPINARPLGLATRTYRMIRRNPMYSALIVLLILLIVVGPTVFLFQQKMANIEIQNALEKAEEEAATSSQVIEYLEEIFKSSNPVEGMGKEISAYELLQQGVAKIDEELKDRPMVRARLLNVMGNTYKWLGISDEAEVLIKNALDIYLDQLGKRDVETLKTVLSLSEVYSQQIRHDEALQLLEEVYQEALVSPRENDVLLAQIMSRLGQQYRITGDYERSETKFLAAIELFQNVQGQEGKRVYTTMTELAWLYIDQGRIDEAEPLLTSSLEICNQHFDDDFPTVTSILCGLGVLNLSKGRLEEAEPYLREAIDRFDRTSGDNHAFAHYIGMNAAEMYWGLERFEEAERLFLKSVDGFKQILGEEHPRTLYAMERLSIFYAEQGRFEEAKSLAREALEKTPQGTPDYDRRKDLLDIGLSVDHTEEMLE